MEEAILAREAELNGGKNIPAVAGEETLFIYLETQLIEIIPRNMIMWTKKNGSTEFM